MWDGGTQGGATETQTRVGLAVLLGSGHQWTYRNSASDLLCTQLNRDDLKTILASMFLRILPFSIFCVFLQKSTLKKNKETLKTYSKSCKPGFTQFQANPEPFGSDCFLSCNF